MKRSRAFLQGLLILLTVSVDTAVVIDHDSTDINENHNGPESDVTGNEMVCLDSLQHQTKLQQLPSQSWNDLDKWRMIWKRYFPINFQVLWSSRTIAESLSAMIATHNRIATSRPCIDPDKSILDLQLQQYLPVDDNCKEVLEVYRQPRGTLDLAYELLEPLELTLGDREYKHVADYAYSPIVHENTKYAMEFTQTTNNFDTFWSGNGGSWWTSYIPYYWSNDAAIQHYRSRYNLNEEAFAGGSHGEVWRGRRRCYYGSTDTKCNSQEPLIFKRLKVELGGYLILEAGLREVYFGNLLRGLRTSKGFHKYDRQLFTEYSEHFFGENGELWIVFKDAGSTLRSFLYSEADAGDYVVYQHSWFWTLIRMSLAASSGNGYGGSTVVDFTNTENHTQRNENPTNSNSIVGQRIIRTFLRQILEAAAFLHDNGDIVHRDIKPSNIMCTSDIDLISLRSLDNVSPQIDCVLGDFSSAYTRKTSRMLYSRGPSRSEQTDEYAPPESIFGSLYNNSAVELTPKFDSWSIGIVALELLLGNPHVFTVDQRTRVILSSKLRKKGATEEEIEKAIYLAALSQFCIYNPSDPNKAPDWPLRDGDPLFKNAMTKRSCTLDDFHRALRARDPLGMGFEHADLLLHLIWKLLEWDPRDRMSASEALQHPYFTSMNSDVVDVEPKNMPLLEEHNALESQMLDPRMDFNISDSIHEFKCPKCGRVFDDWNSCYTHANSRKHAKFCTFDHSSLPTCLNAHSMLPAHAYSGYCDIQGRRRTIEDFHAIHLLPNRQFYGIFDGHLGNYASKFAASFLYSELSTQLNGQINTHIDDWKAKVELYASKAFHSVHEKFLQSRAPYGFMDQSGTTATALLVIDDVYIIASLGDSRAVMSSHRTIGENGRVELTAIQLTKDHVASNIEERRMIEAKGGSVLRQGGIDRVNGTLAITRSIGDPALSSYLSRQPHVVSMTESEILDLCGSESSYVSDFPCFIILASDGLWDTVHNQEAVDLVSEVVSRSMVGHASWRESASMQLAAEALTMEAYVRGSTDNIGVCILAI